MPNTIGTVTKQAPYRPRHAAPSLVRPYVLAVERRRGWERDRYAAWAVGRQRRAVAVVLNGLGR